MCAKCSEFDSKAIKMNEKNNQFNLNPTETPDSRVKLETCAKQSAICHQELYLGQ